MLRKATGGGAAAAAALMLQNTRPSKRVNDLSFLPFDMLLNLQVDRPARSAADLLEHPDAPTGAKLLLRVCERITPEASLIRNVLEALLAAYPSPVRASPSEDQELLELSRVLSRTEFKSCAIIQILFMRVLLRRKAYQLALPLLVRAPADLFVPALWRETVEAVTQGRLHHVDLLNRLLSEKEFPPSRSAEVGERFDRVHSLTLLLQVSDSTRNASSAHAVALPVSGSMAAMPFTIDESIAARLLLATPSNPAIALLILKRYIASARLSERRLHPAPFLAFFKCIQEVRDPETKLPMIHWRFALRYFQLLNKSCPEWYRQYPHEAAELIKYLILTLSAGANPYLTLNLARVSAARQVLDGVELSIWLVSRMSASHHVEEAKQVASKLTHWLFHVIGIHLLAKFHPYIISLGRSLVQLEAIDDVVRIYNIVIDHVQLFSEEFRKQWIVTMRDLVCVCCGTVLQSRNVYEDRTCQVCMHVTPAIPISEAASYEVSAEHLAWLRKKKKAASREGRRRLHAFVLESTSQVPTSSSSPAPVDPAERFSAQVLRNDDKERVSVLSLIGEEASELSSLVLSADASAGDVRAAVEEARRRQKLVEEIRHTRSSELPAASATVPSVITNLTAAVREQFRIARERAVLNQTVRLDGAWRCVWCQEDNPASSVSRINCCACGAETGPEAPWRSFLSESSGDIQQEIRLRIRSGESADALIAAYNLMVYRKTFLLMAQDSDHVLLNDLIATLAHMQERVLAGYLFMRLVPQTQRHLAVETMKTVANLFGTRDSLKKALENNSLNFALDDQIFDVVFNASKTCKVCFGGHDWKICPIVTRDFSKTKVSINLSSEEKAFAAFKHLKDQIASAVSYTIQAGSRPMILDGRASSGPVPTQEQAKHVTLIAYQTFIEANREQFAQEFPVDANHLCRALAFVGEYIRASFVLCHIPLHLRFDASYQDVVRYYGITQDDSLKLLKKRSTVGVADTSHPNFVQVAQTCCICLRRQHASFSCKALVQWLESVLAAFGTSNTTSCTTSDERWQLVNRLRAQVDGWVSSGPERVTAFQRFLSDHLEIFIRTKTEESNPVFYAFNKTVVKLVSGGMHALALRLYTRLPSSFVSPATTAVMLTAAGFSKESIQAMSATSPFQGRENTFSVSDVCLCCFEKGHVFFQCPEVVGKSSTAGRLQQIVETVGCIRSSPVGVKAAADYLYHQYNFAHMSSEMLRGNPELVQSILKLMQRCFASKLLSQGVRLLRRIPLEMVEASQYEAMWKATGMPADVVAERVQALSELFAYYGLDPSCSVQQPRRVLPQELVTKVAALVHEDQCRHCFQYGHMITDCEVFHAEASFGRDFIGTYRMATLLTSLLHHERHCIYAHLLRFVIQHQISLPFYILGVHSGINALSASFSLENEPAMGIKTLQLLPPAYRKRHAIHFALTKFGVPKLECIEKLKSVVVTGDSPAPSVSQHRGDKHASGIVASAEAVMEAQHLLVLRPPIPDVLFDQVFAPVAGVVHSVNDADRRLQELLEKGSLLPRDAAFVLEKDIEQEERERMQLPVNFVDYNKNLMSTVGCSFSAATAATSETPFSNKIVGPMTKPQNVGVGVMVKQVTDIVELREAFEPIISFMEALCGTSIGSRQAILVSSIEHQVLESLTAKQETAPKAAPVSREARAIETVSKEAPVATTVHHETSGSTPIAQSAQHKVVSEKAASSSRQDWRTERQGHNTGASSRFAPRMSAQHGAAESHIRDHNTAERNPAGDQQRKRDSNKDRFASQNHNNKNKSGWGSHANSRSPDAQRWMRQDRQHHQSSRPGDVAEDRQHQRPGSFQGRPSYQRRH